MIPGKFKWKAEKNRGTIYSQDLKDNLTDKRRNQMRRKDREVKEPDKINEIIMSCDCCRLGLADQGSVYIVPMNFGFQEVSGKRFLYFHGAESGRKMELLKKNSSVGFEMDTNHRVNPGNTACGYSFRYQSIIGTGKAALIEDIEEKKEALGLLMEHYSGKRQWTFSGQEVSKTAVIRVEVTELSCKEHQ